MATAGDMPEVEQMPFPSPRRINLSEHTQAELRALADANNANIHSSGTDKDKVIPKVGPGFNESAASRGEITCTLVDGAPCWSSRHRWFSSRYPCEELPDSEEEDLENRKIVSFFKKCMQKNEEEEERETVQETRKRKSCIADTRDDSSSGQLGLQVVKKNSDVVDLRALRKRMRSKSRNEGEDGRDGDGGVTGVLEQLGGQMGQRTEGKDNC